MTTETEAKGEIEKNIKDVTKILEEIVELINKLSGDESGKEQKRGRRKRSTSPKDTSVVYTFKTLENVTNTVSALLVVLFIHYICGTVDSDGVKVVNAISYGLRSMVEMVIEQLETVKHKITAAYAIKEAASMSAYWVSFIDEESGNAIKKAAEKVFGETIVKTVRTALTDVIVKSAGVTQVTAEYTIESIKKIIESTVPGTQFFDTVRQTVAILDAMSRTRPLVSQECNILLKVIDETVGRLYKSAENIIVLTIIVYESKTKGTGMRLHLHRHYHRHSHRHEHKRTYPLTFKLPFLSR
ncbi:hypothetical protein BEWA_001200 [Theileria equi strain WA]|uniref:Uncharacterized protein n=1 Tax=Theileria equi strain WA TaxID=1537102 RepID=L0AZM5_THEEQ|nr:hypothetical protein BEWA_001200 [Theileria equi strain WA]AFZ80713.1 hypothetical protein BEWA_001200 [Theileria equi strain WA]|eukprot:XP_004830379.1 hypothetical protein BEWA_001200 [Theileria equi strain WA]